MIFIKMCHLFASISKHFIRNFIKWGAFSRWSFHPISALGSIETVPSGRRAPLYVGPYYIGIWPIHRLNSGKLQCSCYTGSLFWSRKVFEGVYSHVILEILQLKWIIYTENLPLYNLSRSAPRTTQTSVGCLKKKCME